MTGSEQTGATQVTGRELRPRDEAAGRAWDIAATVNDPEVPVLSIADLGILRDARLEGARAVVVITPTYSGCPAMETITTDVTRALNAEGYDDVRVDLVLQPAWTTDWMSARVTSVVMVSIAGHPE